jgi:outer membrane protein assembly factor BamB
MAAVIPLAACSAISTCSNVTRPLPAPQLVVANGVVYGVAQQLDAWSAASGALLWQAGLRTDLRYSAPVVVGGVIYVSTGASTGASTVLAWRAATGAVLWQSRPTPIGYGSGDVAVPPPVIAGGVVYAGSGAGAIAAWRASDGALLWQSLAVAEVRPDGATLARSIPVPVVAGGMVYYSAANVVTALRARDGQRIWQFGAPGTGAAPLSTPAVASGNVYVAAGDASAFALNGQTGARLWHARPVGSANAGGSAPDLLVYGAAAYLTTRDGMVAALRLSDGALLWRFPVPGMPPYLAARSVGAALLVGSASGIYALNAANGGLIWQAGANLGGSDAALLVAGGTVYAMGQAYLFAWRASDGAFLWQFGQANTPPFIATDTMVYIGVPGTIATCGQTGTPNVVISLLGGTGTVGWRADA